MSEIRIRRPKLARPEDEIKPAEKSADEDSSREKQPAPKVSKTALFLAEKFGFMTRLCAYGAIAIIPLLFSPWTFDGIELPKQTFLLYFTGLGVIFWLVKIVLSKDFSIRRSSLDIFVLIFLVANIVSTIGSINPLTSIWGFYGRGSGSLISTILYVLLYFLITNNFVTKKQIQSLIWTFLGSIGIVALYSILQVFGIFILPFDFTKTKAFSTVGTLNALSMYLVPALAVCVAMLLSKKEQFRMSLTVISALIFIALIATNFTGVWWGLLASMLAVLAVSFFNKETDKKWLVVPGAIAAMSLAMIFSPNFGLNLPKEIQLEKDVAWQTTKSTVNQSPAFGSGPETYVFDFSKYRPEEMNETQAWSLRFDRPNNEYFNILATTGVAGLVSYLALISVSILLLVSYIFKEKEGAQYYTGLGLLAGLVTIAVSNYFSYSNISSLVVFWIILALAVLIRSDEKSYRPLSANTTEVRVFAAAFLIVGMIAIASGFVVQSKALLADAKYKEGVEKSNSLDTIDESLENLKKATGLNPRRDIYNLGVAQILLIKANLEGQKEDFDESAIRDYLTEAIARGQYSIQIVPVSVGNWESMAIIYRNAGIYASDALPWIQTSYETALQLEPTNPYLHNGLGQVFLTKKEYDSARDKFEDAIGLMPNFTDAYFNLGIIYKERKDYDEAVANFDKVLELQPDNEDAKKQKEEVEALKSGKTTQAGQEEFLRGRPPASEQEIQTGGTSE